MKLQSRPIYSITPEKLAIAMFLWIISIKTLQISTKSRRGQGATIQIIYARAQKARIESIRESARIISASHGDEDIIISRIAVQNANQNSIENDVGVTIEGISYQFAEREFPPNFSMVIPERFEELEPEVTRLKYPHENRPGTIISNTDATVNFTFDCMAIESEGLEARLTRYRVTVKRMHPSYVFFSAGTLKPIPQDEE